MHTEFRKYKCSHIFLSKTIVPKLHYESSIEALSYKSEYDKFPKIVFDFS